MGDKISSQLEFNVAALPAEMAMIFSVAVEMHTGLARQRLWAESSRKSVTEWIFITTSFSSLHQAHPVTESHSRNPWLTEWAYKAAALSLYYAAGKPCRTTKLKQPGQLSLSWPGCFNLVVRHGFSASCTRSFNSGDFWKRPRLPDLAPRNKKFIKQPWHFSKISLVTLGSYHSKW